jgi:WD40 repeat protein
MKRTICFLFVIVILTDTVSQAEILYGFQYAGPPVNSRLVAIDIQNGHIASTTSFPVLNAYMQCAAFDDISNTLYGWESNSDSLCTIDIITGIHTIIGGGGGLPSDTMVHCLAISPNTNDMFAMSYSGNLYQVDKTNGYRTHIGKVSSLSHVHGFTFSPDGVPYCSDTTIPNGSQLFTLNTETAEATFVANIPRDYVISLDFDMNGILYGADSGTGQLGIINPTNGDWTDAGSVDDITGMAFGSIPELPALRVSVDVKPQSCPNRLNVKSKGVLPVAILGSEDFNVNTIDVVSIRLAGIAPIRSSYEDVAAPVLYDDECNCTAEGPDGFIDLVLKFETQAIVEALGAVEDGDEWILELTGTLHDETEIVGEDCIIIRAKQKAK